MPSTPAPTTSPFVLNDVGLTLKVGAATNEYMCQLNRAELVPASAASGSEFETFCDTFTAPPKQATWTLEITGFQAYKAAADLSLFLFDNELAVADFVLAPLLNAGNPISATNPAFGGKVTLSPGAIGGTANAYATMTVSLSVVGKPVKVLTPPTLLSADEDVESDEDVEVEQDESVSV